MNWFSKLPGFTRSPPGLERSILRKLPRTLAAGTLIPLSCLAIAWYFPSPDVGQGIERYVADVAIAAVAVVVTVWTAVFTMAIGCLIVVVMKGPAYVADRYPLQDADEPGAHDPPRAAGDPDRHRTDSE